MRRLSGDSIPIADYPKSLPKGRQARLATVVRGIETTLTPHRPRNHLYDMDRSRRLDTLAGLGQPSRLSMGLETSLTVYFLILNSMFAQRYFRNAFQGARIV